MTFNLSKETPSFNLSKEPEKKFVIELKWDKFLLDTDVDLDVDLMAIPLIKGNYEKSYMCNFRRMSVFNKAVYLTRDDRSGGNGEEIYVDTSLLPSYVSEILFFVTFFSNRRDKNHLLEFLDKPILNVKGVNVGKTYVTCDSLDLMGVSHAFVKLVNNNGQWEVVHYDKTYGNHCFIDVSNMLQSGYNIRTNYDKKSHETIKPNKKSLLDIILDFLF